MRFPLAVLFLLTACHPPAGQEQRINLSAAVWNHYDHYREPAIHHRFLKHDEMRALIGKHEERGLFHNEIVGESVRGRSIHHLTIGEGTTPVLMWSQMHGDESTATMALFDLFNFFSARDEHDSLRNLILDNLELHIIPMLNPDGAEVWQRRNALDIDINRDARQLATPEGRALMDVARKVKPMFGFNLHDQSVYYSAGPTPRPATISFLAPAFNEARDMNDVRARATRVIMTMNEVLQEKIPGQVGRYDDTFDPRCFGDTFQGMDISTILIESGGHYDDIEKQEIRRLNFIAILRALESIARGDYAYQNVTRYDTIPENRRSLFDLVIRNVTVEKEGQTYKTHIAINRRQRLADDYKTISYLGVIEEIGDLNNHYGYEDSDAEGLRYSPGKVKNMSASEWQSLNRESEITLMRHGFLYVATPGEKAADISGRLLKRVNSGYEAAAAPKSGDPARFMLMRENERVMAVVNGEVFIFGE